jgi:hypothetical protein
MGKSRKLRESTKESPADASVGVVAAGQAVDSEAMDAAGRFVGQWNRLVSTTNWEKGRIICQWRDALIAASAPVTTYSDEAWSQLVGGVTSQHVGRLRRVFQRFGDVSDQYEGLYWSHFQAAMDWEDSEMWLEGAIHNGWSVSQMRGKRWETLGLPGEPSLDESALADELASDDVALSAGAAAIAAAIAEDEAAAAEPAGPAERTVAADAEADAPFDDDVPAAPAKSRARLSVDVDELPSDLADAFEQFKLAIIAQRRLGWSETTPEAVIECLDALKTLVLAPGDD